MNTKRFFLSWLFSSLVMFSLSYLWHGVILNDIARLSYPLGIFLTSSIVVYLILGFLLTRIFTMQFHKHIAKRPFLKGLISGAILGASSYLFALVIGVSFNSSLTPEYILIDILWQIIEQSAGGITVAIVYVWLYDDDLLTILTRKLFGD
ncbi:MAG: hypothetical protein V1781_00765 [Bacteroidota bacterium]